MEDVHGYSMRLMSADASKDKLREEETRHGVSTLTNLFDNGGGEGDVRFDC